MSRKLHLTIVLCFVFSLTLSPALALTGTEKNLSGDFSEALLLQPGEYRAYIVHLAVGDKLSVKVQMGPGSFIDVYTMTSFNYNTYRSGAKYFTHETAYSRENTLYFEYPNQFSPASEGDYVVVIDNANVSANGAVGSDMVGGSMDLKIEKKAPFPWLMVFAVIIVIIVVAALVIAFIWMRKKKAEIEETERQKKRAEAAKVRPIFIQQPGGPGAPGMPGTPSMQASPPSSSCKSCPHVYDPTSANCIACEYR